MSSVAPRHLVLLVGITLIWGLNLVANKYGVAECPPILFTLLRFAVLAAILTPFLKIHRGQMSPLIVAAVLSGGLNFALMIVGLSLAKNVSSVAIAGQLGVPFTTLLSVALLGEVVRWRRWTGVALSFAGILVMGFDPQIWQNGASVGFVIAAAFVGALGVIAVKRLQGIKPLELQAWFAWISLPLLATLSLLIERPNWQTVSSISSVGWLAVAYTALAASLVGHTAFYYLVQRYPVTSVAPLTNLSPVFSVVFAVLILHDHLSARLAAGGAITLLGTFIITLRERRIVDVGS